MIHYKKASELSNEAIVKAFNAGFIDYIIQLTLDEEKFVKHFLGLESNKKEYSFVAFDDEGPIGVIIGGLKQYEGKKTLRCGALSVAPKYRKQGVAQSLFNLHKELAIELGCERLYLEVIQGNVKAINFYFKNNYKILSEIMYFELNQTESLTEVETDDFDIREISTDIVEEIHKSEVASHLNWQNDFDYMKKIPITKSLGFYHSNELVSVITYLPNGKIFYLYTKMSARNKGYAKVLLAHLIKTYSLNKVTMSFPYVETLKSFLLKLGFTKSSVQQYDMSMDLDQN